MVMEMVVLDVLVVEEDQQKVGEPYSIELNDLQLAVIGGGIGDIVAA